MNRKICKITGCGARAWQSELCNLHALEHHRGARRKPTVDRLAEGRRLLRQRAKELGIVLADEPQEERVQKRKASAVVTARSKVRSPVG